MFKFNNKDTETTSLTQFETSQISERKKMIKLFQNNIE